jgi:ribonuclease BN (tRNA processing enzyme)
MDFAAGLEERMPRLSFLTLGVGDAFSARHFSSCLAVTYDGSWLLVDCPHPILKMLAHAVEKAGRGPEIGTLQGVILTHLHGDHVSGLEILGYYFRFVLQRRLPIFLHADVLENLWPHSLAGSMKWTLRVGKKPQRHRLADFFQVKVLSEKKPVPLGPFSIRCRPVVHSIPAIALRLSAGGRELGYSGDTVFDPALLDWLSAADLVVHEAGEGFAHTPYEKLAELAPELRRRMRLIHYPDRFDPAASVIRCLREGEWCDV